MECWRYQRILQSIKLLFLKKKEIVELLTKEVLQLKENNTREKFRDMKEKNKWNKNYAEGKCVNEGFPFLLHECVNKTV